MTEWYLTSKNILSLEFQVNEVVILKAGARDEASQGGFLFSLQYEHKACSKLFLRRLSAECDLTPI